MKKVIKMKVLLGVSNRHVHLNEEDFKILFEQEEMENIKDLVQPGQFASNLTVDIKTEKNTIKKVRVLGPLRPYTQAEVSKTDSFTLGIKPPVRESGDLDSASTVTLIGPCGEITKECAIIANRHIHVTKELREKYGLTKDVVSIKVEGEKPGIIEGVSLKETSVASLELHLDTDDANAFLLKTGDMLEIIED